MTNVMEFDDIQIDTLREVGSIKWTMFPEAIGAFVAEMDFGIAPSITQALHAAVDVGAFGYLPPGLSNAMSAAFAAYAERSYGWNLDAESVRPVADVIAALEVAIEHFSPPGSAVVLPTPAYMPFLTVPLALGRQIIQVPMLRENGRFVYDLEALETAFANGGGLLILCNPHNPGGRVMEQSEMAAIADIVGRHGGRVFSDEIHAPLVYPGFQHVPYASVSELAANHTLTATSASKAWNLPGMKCAQVILTNDSDRALWAEQGRMFEHGAANLGVIANTAAYTAGAQWLRQVIEYLDGNRQLLADLVTEHLPGVPYTPPEGTYLAWLDCNGLDLGESPASFFAERAGVAMTDGAMCGDVGKGVVRFNFATPRPIMIRALEQMGAALRAR